MTDPLNKSKLSAHGVSLYLAMILWFILLFKFEQLEVIGLSTPLTAILAILVSHYLYRELRPKVKYIIRKGVVNDKLVECNTESMGIHN